MKAGMRWTPDEDQILRDNFHDCSWEELLDLLPGRTQPAIDKRGQRLGLRRARVRSGNGFWWTSAEDRILREMFYDQPVEDILAALPGRTWYGVHDRAVRLGVRRKHMHAGRELAKRKTDKPVMDAVIQFFYEHGFGPQRADITRMTGFTHSTITRSVDRLIERGLLIRGSGRFSAVGLAPALRKKLLDRERAERDRVKAVA